MSRIIVVFSGFNQRAVVAFLRTVTKKNLNYAIIALSQHDPIFLTEYKKDVYAIRENIALTLSDIMHCLEIVKQKSKSDYLFIAPTTEALNRFLLDNRLQLEQVGCEIPLVDKDLYQCISDKKSFCDVCQSHDIVIPKEVAYSKDNIPLVLKPKYYKLGDLWDSPVIIDSDQKFDAVVFDSDKFYCQEYVEGCSYYLLYYFSKRGEVYKLCQENMVQQPMGKSITAARILPSLPIKDKFVNLFQQLKFYGLVMVEVRIKDGDFCMIEANPRFWGPSQLFVDYGMNLFEYFLADNGFDITCSEMDLDENALYFWAGGMHEQGMVYHNQSEFDYATYYKYDIYRRIDTMEVYRQELVSALVKSYNAISKHSQYQVLPSVLSRYIPQDSITIKSRSETQRWKYITDKVSIQGKTILDIGANTGFFSIESLCAGAKQVTAFEGNGEHARFLEIVSDLLDYKTRFRIEHTYYTFTENEKYDICFLLNVLHHVGDDYGDKTLTIQKAKELMIKQLNQMASHCDILVLQIGFNWKGDRNVGLFQGGTKKEVIDFIKSGISDAWDLESIGIAEKDDDSIIYRDLSRVNIKRDDSLGEFLNRPIFVLKSKCNKKDR